MTAVDPHTLTGAYALNALPDEERLLFERHLARCESCAREVAGLAAAAAALGLTDPGWQDPALRERVLRRIGAVPQDRPVPEPDGPPGPGAPGTGPAPRGFGPAPGADRRRAPRPAGHDPADRRRPAADSGPARTADGRPASSGVDAGRGGGRIRAGTRWALAACLTAAAGLGGTAVWQQGRAQDARAEARQMREDAAATASVLTAPDARTGTARLPGGARAAVVVSRTLDRAVFVGADMAEPPRGKVYQLWFDDGGTMRPAGLMDPARTDQSVLMRGTVDGAGGMGVTVEPAGGSAEPTSAPIAVLSLPS